MSELIALSIKDGVVICDSRDVAEKFGKRHDHVLQAIRDLECSEKFRVPNFRETPYIHPQNGQTYPCYEITRDGFMFLAMGFTGAAAAAWKEKFIAAFNAMDAELRARSCGMSQDGIIAAVRAFASEVFSEMLEKKFLETQAHVVRGITAGEILDLAKITSRKGLKGLATQVSSWMRQYCLKGGIKIDSMPVGRRGVYLFPPMTAREWLAAGGKTQIERYIAERRGQGVLHLVQPEKPKHE